MALPTYSQYSIQEDDTRGKSYAAWVTVCDEIDSEGKALRRIREEYDRDPRPLRMVKITYQTLVEMHRGADGGLNIEVDGDAKVTMDQAIDALTNFVKG